MSERMKTCILMILMAALMLIAGIGYAEEPSGDGWDKWGVGDELFSVGEPWKALCKTEKKCGSLKEGVEDGQTWGSSIGYYHRKHSHRIYAKYKPWFVLWSGGAHGIWLAQTCRTESEGETDNVTKSKYVEAGLCSVNKKWAKQLDINSCDPKANVWATGWMRNDRLIRIRYDYPHIGNAGIEQQWFIAGAGGGTGTGKVMKILKKCGNQKSTKPHEAFGKCLIQWHRRFVKATTTQHWIKKLGLDSGLSKMGITHKKWEQLEKYTELYDPDGEFRKHFYTSQGYNPWLVAFRGQRHEGVKKQMTPLFEDGELPWGDPVIPNRPNDLYPYPGDKLHGKCWNWPELKERVPTQEEWDSMIVPTKDVWDPADIMIIKGYKGKLIGCLCVKDEDGKCLKCKKEEDDVPSDS